MPEFDISLPPELSCFFKLFLGVKRIKCILGSLSDFFKLCFHNIHPFFTMPEFDISLPPELGRGSYHPITLVQRECERIFKSMGFTVEDYSEVVTDYECFESLNIPF